MNKPDFYNILCKSTPEELNKFISSKGTKKMVNAVTFMDDYDNKNYGKETKNENDTNVQNVSADES